MAFSELNPPGIQRYVLEHIVKNDDGAVHVSSQRLRSFSGRVPRQQHDSDYEAWRSGVDLLLKDPAVSDLQRSRKILETSGLHLGCFMDRVRSEGGGQVHPADRLGLVHYWRV